MQKKIVAFIKDNKLDILVVLALFLFAFGLRSIPHQTFPGIYGFDAYYNARITRDIILTGGAPYVDSLAYWPEGKNINNQMLHHYTLAAVYTLVEKITLTPGYDEDLFVLVNNFFIPFVGGMAVVAIYLLGRELRGRKSGLIAALVLAVSTNQLMRTMYGFSEEDALGMFFVVFSLFAYIWALKRGTWKHGLLAGIVFALFCLTWPIAMFTGALVAAFVFVQACFFIYNRNGKMVRQYLKVYAASLIPIAIAPFIEFLARSTAIEPVQNTLMFALPVAGLLLIADYWLNYHKKGITDMVPKLNITKEKLYQIAIVLLILLAAVGVFFKGEYAYNTTINMVTGGEAAARSMLMRTVGEENPKTMDGVINELGWYAPIVLFAIPYLAITILMKRKKVSHELLPLIYIIVAIFLYAEKAKFGYIFGPAVGIVMGVVLSDLFDFSKKIGEWPKRLVLGVVVFLLFTQVAVGFQFMEQYKATYSTPTGWTDMYAYLQDLPEQPAIMTWWDYGHWSAWYGIRTTLDNTNANHSKVMQTARIFTDFRGSTVELEERHLWEESNWQVTHVAIDRVLLYQKWGALTYLGENYCIPNAELAEYGLSFPQLSEMSVLSEACPYGYTYAGDIGIAGCRPITIETDTGGQDHVECHLFEGAPLRFTKDEWDVISTTNWPGYTLMISTGEESIKLKVYGQRDYSLIYFKFGSRVIEDAPVNYMYGMRLFFQDPGFKYHKLVVDAENNLPNKDVVLYEIEYPPSGEMMYPGE